MEERLGKYAELYNEAVRTLPENKREEACRDMHSPHQEGRTQADKG